MGLFFFFFFKHPSLSSFITCVHGFAIFLQAFSDAQFNVIINGKGKNGVCDCYSQEEERAITLGLQRDQSDVKLLIIFASACLTTLAKNNWGDTYQ